MLQHLVQNYPFFYTTLWFNQQNREGIDVVGPFLGIRLHPGGEWRGTSMLLVINDVMLCSSSYLYVTTQIVTFANFQGPYKKFPRAKLNFQGPPTRNVKLM